jgi:hypothetical protein
MAAIPRAVVTRAIGMHGAGDVAKDFLQVHRRRGLIRASTCRGHISGLIVVLVQVE